MSTTLIKFDPAAAGDAEQPSSPAQQTQPEQTGETAPKSQPTIIEIVDTRLHVVLARRHEHVMNRTLRIRTAYAKDNVGLSNSHRITF